MTPPAKKILIVDDEPRNLKLLNTLLSSLGYDILAAEGGQQAIEIVGGELPDLILLDLMMPGMDGFDVVRLLKAHPEANQVPIVMVTAVDDAGSRARLESAGVAEFIIKPIDRWALQACVEKVLANG